MKPILTSCVGTNADLFLASIELYVENGAKILDATYGKGVFWRNIDVSKYELIKNDLDAERGDIHEDFRHMSFSDEYFDAIILDPPYAGHSSNKKSFAHSIYNNDKRESTTSFGTLNFYYEGIREAKRLLKKNGILFVKCMDEIESGKQKRNHIDIWNFSMSIGMVDEDLFILIQKQVPVMRHKYQKHARKNNSFLWVFRK